MMDLRGQQQEKRLGLSNSLGGFNPPTIGDPPTKISSINTTTGNGIAILTSPRHSGATLDHHNHHHQQQQQQQHFHHHHQQQRQQQQQQQNQNHNRQDESSPEPPPPPPPPPPQHHHHQTQAIDTDTDRDPDPVSIAVVSAAIQPISTTTGSNPRTPRPKIRYRECLKNHAASIGGHVVDGCGEFMPGGEEGSAEALKCAACDCHRNFHRKEFQGDHHHHHHHHNLHHHSHQHGVGGGGNCFYCYNNNNNNKGVVDNSRRNTRIPAQPIQHHPQQQQQKFSLGLPLPPSSGGSPPVVMMTFGGGGGGGGGGAATESSSEELNTAYHSNAGGHVVAPQFSLSKKRFRTKFSQEQKDRMLEFAEKVGWRIQKQDENAVQQFCAEVGVKRQVFKVWMHNNKHAIKKKDLM